MQKTKITKCRFCGNPFLVPCINLGSQYLSSIFPKNISYRKNIKKQPLNLVLCKKNKNSCGVLQLSHSFNMSKMYEEYPFTSSTNSSMPKILKDVLDSALSYVDLKEKDLILDIGGNDGTLLSYLKNTKCDLLCIDPAQNIKPIFTSKKFKIITDYFNEKVYKSATKKKAKIIFSIAMFYHLYDPIKFSKEIEACLSDDGIWVIQMAYLPTMIKTNMYDNVVHEHVGYYAIDNMHWIMEKVGLEIFDVTLNDTYGGSFRLFIKKKGCLKYPKSKRYNKELKNEKKLQIYNPVTYKKFMKRVEKTRIDLLSLCKKIKSEGKSIWIYGASTKGNTILQYCGITKELIEAAADANPFKFEKYIIGSNILIKKETEMRLTKPDYLLALPYSFINAFIKREAKLVKDGTKFIIPLPKVKIIK
ncbi:MAG: class I SAM-dependent methyltransferase [Candidatus Paceibacterota bacterium]